MLKLSLTVSAAPWCGIKCNTTKTNREIVEMLVPDVNKRHLPLKSKHLNKCLKGEIIKEFDISS